MDIQETQRLLSEYLHELADLFHRVPGSAIFLRYVKSSYQNDPIRSAVELFLFLFAVRYLLAPKYSTKPGVVQLSEDEIDDLVDEWTPEPLVGKPTALEEMEVDKRTVIVGPVGPKSKLANGRTVINLGSYNFYNFNTNESLKEKAIQTLRNYGVGPCGPRGFYGTQDVHMKTEADVASFLGTASCIMYSQAFSTISSVIPAFSKRGDIIVADKGVNFAIRKGIQISRSMVRWYEHNDMEDLERVLAKVTKEQARKPLTRRFIITEGLFESYGDMVNLPKIIELKLKYKFRLILDESWSFGVLGRTGRGVTEHQNVDAAEVDMIVGSLAGPLVAGGGFCAGSEEIVHHQRISAAAYTFSAALPALLSTTASATINLLQNSPETISLLREYTKAMWAQLDPRSDWVYCTSAPENPIMILAIKPEVIAAKRLSIEDQQFLLQDVVDECLANGVLITRLKTLQDNFEPKQVVLPALKVYQGATLPHEAFSQLAKRDLPPLLSIPDAITNELLPDLPIKAQDVTKYGISYAPYNDDGTCKSQDGVNSDLDKLKPWAFVRIYGVDCDQTRKVVKAARERNLRVFAGVYDLQNFPASLDHIIEAAAGDWSIFHTINIGNELVNKGHYSWEVFNAVHTARDKLRAAGYQGPVVTVDTFSVLLRHPELCDASDYCAANCHAFFDANQTPLNAGEYTLNQANAISAAAGGKRTVITEAGWPHAGQSNGKAAPNIVNQWTAILTLANAFQHRRDDLILFSAFDDPWKQDGSGTFGAEKYWGLLKH
ncbi:serine palmitoyltransferase component [Aspergillus hancockii]|nr:serine palmitoyltransferase component [Aspergillus hancockii]